MNIVLTDVGKRFNADWIFRKVSLEFAQGRRYAITGPNGSGKSTLLQVIGAHIHPNEGSIGYTVKGTAIPAEKVFKYISIAAPYLEVIEEMTLQEFLNFHRQLKPFIPAVSNAEIAASVGLGTALNKQIRYYSSGMKQRVKLAQAIFSDTALLLLDEPLTNLDAEGGRTYNMLIQKYAGDRTVIVSSNDEREFHFCESIVDINEFK